MNLLNPLFLLGLTAVSVPIILHLIQRQRYPERPFTTLRFFDKTIKHNVIKRRFVDKLLLLLRVLFLAALMIGLARPFGSLGIGEKRMSVVVVLDNSPSMGRASDGLDLFGKAKASVAEALNQLAPEDRAALVLSAPAYAPRFTTDRTALKDALEHRSGQLTGLLKKSESDGVIPVVANLTRTPQEIIAVLEEIPENVPLAVCGYGDAPDVELTTDHRQIAAHLEEAALAARQGDVYAALEKARDLLEDSKDADRSIILVSDLQESDWNKLVEQNGIDLRDMKVRVVEVAPPKEEKLNLAIEKLDVPKKKARFGERVMCTARIANKSSVPSLTNARLRILVGSEDQVNDVKVPLPAIAAHTAELVTFAVPAVGRGETIYATAQLQCPGDAFEYDNFWHFTIAIRPPVRMLVINGRMGETTGDRSGFFIVNALAPRTPWGQATPFAEIEECTGADIAGKDLFPFNVVVLAGLDKLSEEARTKITDFVSDGGGLLVFPDVQPTPEEYNGWKFLPATVESAVSGNFVYVQEVSEKATAVAALSELGEASYQSLSTSNWLKVLPDENATVPVRFSSESPALVEGALGKGRVMLACTSGHTSGSDWPLRPAFVLLIRDLTVWLADPGKSYSVSGTRNVGEGLAMNIPPEMATSIPGAFRMAMTGIGAEYQPLIYERRSDKLVLPWSQKPGHYLLTLNPTAEGRVLSKPGLGCVSEAMAVNHSTQESTLSPISSKQITASLKDASVDIAPVANAQATDVASLRTGRDLWRYALLAALILMFAEGLIAWRWPTDASS